MQAMFRAVDRRIAEGDGGDRRIAELEAVDRRIAEGDGGDIKPTRCPFCKHAFINKSDIKLHVKTHLLTTKFKGAQNKNTCLLSGCDFCPQGEGSLSKIIRHIMQSHMSIKEKDPKIFICKKCGFNTTHSYNFKAHKRKKKH